MRSDSANRTGVPLVDRVREPHEALVEGLVGVLLLEEERVLVVADGVRRDDEMRDAARPRHLLDEHVKDGKLVELVLLLEDVPAEERDLGLESGRAGRGTGLVLRLLAVEEHADGPLLHRLHRPSGRLRQLFVVDDLEKVARRQHRLVHDELVLGGVDGGVPDELHLRALEGDRVVVHARRPRHWTEPVEIGLLVHHRERRDEPADVTERERILLRDDASDLLGFGPGDLAAERAELNQVRRVGRQPEDDVGTIVDDGLESVEIDVGDVLDPGVLELLGIVGKVAGVHLEDLGAALRFLEVLLLQLLIHRADGERRRKPPLGGLAVLLDYVIAFKTHLVFLQQVSGTPSQMASSLRYSIDATADS